MPFTSDEILPGLGIPGLEHPPDPGRDPPAIGAVGDLDDPVREIVNRAHLRGRGHVPDDDFLPRGAERTAPRDQPPAVGTEHTL